MQNKKFPVAWQENEKMNSELISKQQPISLQEAKAQVKRLKEKSKSLVKKGHNTIKV